MAGKVEVGDRVVMYIVLACGNCRYCGLGRTNLCEGRTTMAYHHDGAFAPYMKVPAQAVARGHLFRVEADLPRWAASSTRTGGWGSDSRIRSP
jgi:L-iditol 2-dehydrogenase